MPYAPEGLAAVVRQPLSRENSESRQPNWLWLQPYSASMARAMSRGSPLASDLLTVTWPPESCESVRALVRSTLPEVREAERETEVSERSTTAAPPTSVFAAVRAAGAEA